MINLFLTGVEYNPDKIFITAGLTALMQSLGYSTGVYKPILYEYFLGSIKTDEFSLVKFTDPFIKTYYSYLLKESSSPLISAASINKVIEKNIILGDYQKIQDLNEFLIVEGTSGLTTPLNKNFMEEDIVKMLDLPLLFAVSCKNHSINNTILAINHAKEIGISIRGIILNNYPKNSENPDIKFLPKLIEEYTEAKVLGILPEFERNINPADLISEVLCNIDVESVFNIKIPKLFTLN